MRVRSKITFALPVLIPHKIANSTFNCNRRETTMGVQIVMNASDTLVIKHGFSEFIQAFTASHPA